jgi:hypothetical protein
MCHHCGWNRTKNAGDARPDGDCECWIPVFEEEEAALIELLERGEAPRHSIEGPGADADGIFDRAAEH